MLDRRRLNRLLVIAIAGLLAAASVGAASASTIVIRRVVRHDCAILPPTNVWNRRVDGLAVRSDSAALMATMGLTNHLHPDFSSTGYGIPFNVVSSTTLRSSVTFTWPSESDAGPYPIPATPKIEGGSDLHLLMLDPGACQLWELFNAQKLSGHWSAGSGAFFDLRSNALRPDGWTSADAAGLPIYPGAGPLRRGAGRLDRARPEIHRLLDTNGPHLPGSP